jgi:hypothetical protein
MSEQRRIKHTEISEERAGDEAKRLREEAEKCFAAKREALLSMARQAELDAWLRSPGLRPPR